MTDETPKRPDEKDDAMTEDDHDPHVPEVTRREAMSTPAKAALGGAGVLGILGLSTSTASAQQSVEEPAQLLRDDQDREVWWRIDDAGHLVLVHGPSGAEVRYDTNIDAWTTNATFDLSGNDVQNVGSFDSESVSTEDLYNADRNPSVVVKKRNGTIYAINSEGMVDSGSDATAVIQSALDSLTSGRTWLESIKVKGDYTLTGTLTVGDYTHCDFYGAYFTLSDSFSGGEPAMETVNQAEVACIEGGLFDGNRSNLSSQINDGFLLVGDGTDGTDYHHPYSVVRDCHFKNFTRTGFQDTVRRSLVVNVSATNCGNRSIDIDGGDSLYLSLGVDGATGNGIAIRNAFNVLINPMVEGCEAAGIVLESTGRDTKIIGGFTEFNTHEGIDARGVERLRVEKMFIWGNDQGGIRFAGGPSIDASSNLCHVTECRLGGSGQSDDIIFEGGESVVPQHNLIHRNIYADNSPSIVADGLRNIINGRSTNDGNPTSGGEWNGYADLAALYDVTVYDTSASAPYPAYVVNEDGSTWEQDSRSTA